MSDIPIRPRRSGIYVLTEQDKRYLKSFAVDGVIPHDDYIKATNTILNKDVYTMEAVFDATEGDRYGC